MEQVENKEVDPGISLESTNINPAEDQARQSGWRPLEEWEGNPEDWVDAKEFNRRGEYMDRIKSQSSLIKKLEKKQSQLEQTLNELSEHHKRVAQIEREKALKELKQLKRDALDIGDHEKVVEIDDKILDLKKQEDVKEPQQKAPVQNLHPDVQAWVDDNTWFQTDSVMRGAAEALVQEIVENNPELQGNVKKVLGIMEEKIREEFPHKFRAKRSMVTEPTGAETTPAKSSPKYTPRHLNDEQRRVGERFVKAGAVKSLQEYVNQLAEIGELSAQKGA